MKNGIFNYVVFNTSQYFLTDYDVFRVRNIINIHAFKLFFAITKYFNHSIINHNKISIRLNQTRPDISIIK